MNFIVFQRKSLNYVLKMILETLSLDIIMVGKMK